MSTLGSLRTPTRRLFLRLASGWDVLRAAFDAFLKNGDANQAAAVALYGILSFIPIFILSILAAGRILGANPEIQARTGAFLKGINPYFSTDLVAQLGQVDAKLPILGALGVLTLVWFSSMIFGAIETALNITFRSRVHRNYLTSKALAIAMIPLGWAVAILSLGLTAAATLLTARVDLLRVGSLGSATQLMFRYVIPYLVSVLFVAIVYQVIPSRRIRLSVILVGSAIFSALIEVVKQVFTWWVANHTKYHVIFGSLETVVVLVLWMFYVALIFLFCAEIMAAYERRDLILLERALLSPARGIVSERLLGRFGRPYRAGTQVFREGDRDQEMYYVLTGRIRLEKKAGRVRKVLAEMGPGQYFGEMAALIDAPRSASAVAAEDSELAVIDGRVFQHLLRESETVSLLLLREFAQRIKRTNTALDDLSQTWIRLVVVAHLARHGPGDRVADLARITGKDPSDVQEVLEELASLGVLELEGGRITGFLPDRGWEAAGLE
jgi:membrane protein